MAEPKRKDNLTESKRRHYQEYKTEVVERNCKYYATCKANTVAHICTNGSLPL